jgi:hypothetical protein
MMMTALANGAPEAPLPMVTSGMGVERPSRFSMAAAVAPVTTAANGATLVRTVAITPSVPAAGGAPAPVALKPLSILPPGSDPAPAVEPVRVRTVSILPPVPSGAMRPSPASDPGVAMPAAASVVPPAAAKRRPVASQPLDLTRYMPLK